MENKIQPQVMVIHVYKYQALSLKGAVCQSNKPAQNCRVMTDNTSLIQMMHW